MHSEGRDETLYQLTAKELRSDVSHSEFRTQEFNSRRDEAQIFSSVSHANKQLLDLGIFSCQRSLR